MLQYVYMCMYRKSSSTLVSWADVLCRKFGILCRFRLLARLVAHNKHEDKKKIIIMVIAYSWNWKWSLHPTSTINNWRHGKGSSDIPQMSCWYAVQQMWCAIHSMIKWLIDANYLWPSEICSFFLHERKQIFCASSHQRHRWHSPCLLSRTCAPVGIGTLQNLDNTY